MGAFANAVSRRSHPKVTKTVKMSDEIRHSSQSQWNLQSNEAATATSACGSIFFGGLLRCGRSGTRIEIARRSASERILQCFGLAGFGITLMNVPENSAFGTSKVGPKSMPGGTGTIHSVVLSPTGGFTTSGRTGCTAATTTTGAIA